MTELRWLLYFVVGHAILFVAVSIAVEAADTVDWILGGRRRPWE